MRGRGRRERGGREGRREREKQERIKEEQGRKERYRAGERGGRKTERTGIEIYIVHISASYRHDSDTYMYILCRSQPFTVPRDVLPEQAETSV